ncbi:MAG TPA: bifunctional 2-polyprenyl-6-hydroxyphenol methylase/3-demethylubiquinol 3-O-methyltransferase UbiG [Kiloniellaceae bacterium]|nr:bifunctional 2-polyprenyl-6-hydroxyphenol methylase/3-demethylubiquinol 3-O-methyltransferase UbiG [Kiloniellaceae bacterium]
MKTAEATKENGAAPSLDEQEVAKFSAIAEEWWDTEGSFRPLHRLNPTRLRFIRDHCLAQFGGDTAGLTPLKGLKILDIGCGGGLLCEPLTRLGAQVTGIDPSERNITVAALHAKAGGLKIDYRATSAEALAESGARFDAVLTMEVLEHVADVPGLVQAAGSMLRDGGLLFGATLNRTPKSFAFAIVGAEYLLRWLPRGTHDWRRFVKPSELATALRQADLGLKDLTGVVYNPVDGSWRPDPKDLEVNYMLVAAKD